MMKQITLIAILILSGLFAKAQVGKMKVSWSENMKKSKNVNHRHDEYW